MRVDDMAGIICQALGCGVRRSKRQAMRWRRRAVEGGDSNACLTLASGMYGDHPYAREVGQAVDAAGVAAELADEGAAEVLYRHDVPADILIGVVQWLLKGGAAGIYEGDDGRVYDPAQALAGLRNTALEGGNFCLNEACEFEGQLKDFKVCPQCKTARYCGEACQTHDWTSGGHKETCGAFHSKLLGTRLS